jgi:hypothetical protein
MAFGKFISKKIRSSSSDGDFLTIGNVVTSQTYFHGFQSLSTIDQITDFGSDENNIFLPYDQYGITNQSGIITNTFNEIGGDARSVCNLFSLGNGITWLGFANNGTMGTTGLVDGSQMLGFPNADKNLNNNPRYILLQGWKNYRIDWIDIEGSSVDWDTPSTYAGIPVYLYYSASPFQGLTVTPPSGTGDTVRSVGFIFGRQSGAFNSGGVIIFFDPDGFYVQL